MDFYAIIDQVVPLLQKHGRMTYRAIKYQFQLDDEGLAVLRDELIEARGIAVDQDGKVLVWKDRLAYSVQSLGSEEHQPLTQSPQTLDPRLKDSRLDAAERRQLTVMFCDLVGSTALSAQLDPEDLREVVRQYQHTCAEVIQRHEGYIAQYLGDGLLVYFGYPTAHEDDARRAVRSGLEIVDALKAGQGQQTMGNGASERPRALQVRIGIHTGLVVIGEIGSSEKREILALGETPNIAARVQGQAEPDTVVISQATYRLVQGLFTYTALGPQVLKNVSDPLELYRVHEEGAARSRFEVSVRTGLTPLIGRAPELGLLKARWEQAKTGAGQVVLLSGEPGIGKSRLVQEFKEQLAPEGTTRIEFRCSPYHQNSALYPIIDHLQHLLQFTREDSALAKLEKLQHTLSLYRFPQADTVPLVAALLSLPHPAGFSPIAVSSQKQKEQTQAALVAWLVEETERAAVYGVWEDVHWADPSTLEVLTLLLDQVPTTRLLAVLTFRPEFMPPWGNRSHLSQLTLSRLERHQVEAMVERVTRGKALPSEVVRHIVAKTDGVPLFVEELTKTVVESGVLTAVTDHYELNGPLPPLAIPSTLQDSLMARLDRLSTVREIAQLGATIGREFSYELLQAVSLLDEGTLQQGLKQLVDAELVYQRGVIPQAHYLFKHALIQDTAYQSLLKSTRQQSHTKIAQVLAERFPETVETQPELLAQHYTEADLIAQALPYWQRAGERATQRSAYVEAVAHLNRGLELLSALPNSPEHLQQELTLQTTLGTTLTITKGWAAPDVEKAYARARELCRQVGETPQLLPVLFGLYSFHLLRAEHKTARELAEQIFHLAQSQQDPALHLWPHCALGLVLHEMGELTSARAHLEQGIALYDPQQHRPHGSQVLGQDPKVTCLSYISHTLWRLGYLDQARQRSAEVLTLAQELSHPFSLAFALGLAAGLNQFLGDVQADQAMIEALLTLSHEQGFPFWLTWGAVRRGYVLAEQGQSQEGIALMRQGMTTLQAIGSALGRSWLLALLAEAYGKAGQAEEGLRVLAEGFTIVSKTGERGYEADLYRLKGTLTLQQERQKAKIETDPQSLNPDPLGEAEAYFLKAIEIAQRQQAKSLELRAVRDLSRLWQQQGKQKDAHQMLVEIYGWFTEGFDTKDLQEAKALLDSLESGV